MTEEEKKAINDLLFIIVTDIYDNEVRIDKTKVINEYNQSLQTVLNLVKKQQEEIEKYKGFYHRRLKEWKKRFENQDKHFLNELDEYDEERKRLQKELEKKNEVIYLMAKYFYDTDSLCVNDEVKVECNHECIDCIKQYFENKVEGSK